MRAAGAGAASGTVVDVPLAVWDIPSTFAELAGVGVPSARDGVSFAPALRGEAQSRHAHLYWQFTGRSGGFDEAVRFGGWKAVRRKNHPTELYRLTEDPGETRDLASAFPAQVLRAEELMAEALA